MRQDGFKLSSKKTAILSFSLAILITLSAVFTFNAAGALYADNSFAEGEGTVDNPYIISNLADLKNFRDYVEDSDNKGKDEYFKLNNDIDMSIEGQSWKPIGASKSGFAGTLDGCGNTIKNLYINLQTDSGTNSGLFFEIAESGTVKNLTVTGTITGSNSYGSAQLRMRTKEQLKTATAIVKLKATINPEELPALMTEP